MLRQLVTLGASVMLAGWGGAAFAQTGSTPAPAKQVGTENPQKDEKAKPDTLVVGDPAPPLTIENWVKGEPVTGFEKGRVYVVEFWATWCGPCIKGMPHLSELQRKYKDRGLTIIGISSKPWRGETIEKVKPFVEKMGDKMAYTVAYDTGPTNAAYMVAAGRNSIPHAFIVSGEGRIAYIGHPASGQFNEALERTIDGNFTSADAAALDARWNEKEKGIQALRARIQTGVQNSDYDDAVAAIDELMKADPGMAPQYANSKFMLLLTRAKDYKAAYAFGNEAVDSTFKDDAQVLNFIAWNTLATEGVEERDLALAMKAAKRANELTGNEDPSIIDTLAKAYFDSGDVAKAIELQTKAVGLATDETLKAELQTRLDEYNAKK